MDNYYDKLKALLEGLEIEKIDGLLANGDADTYRLIGEMIARQCKIVKKDGGIKNGNQKRTARANNGVIWHCI